MGRPRILLVEGPAGVGKTALVRRFCQGSWASDAIPTIGLDEDAGTKTYTLESEGLHDELRAVLPPDGLELAIWEIGGSRGGHLRQAPRGQPIDGLLLCYNVFDRASFQNVAHRLMQHRTDRHLQFGTPSLVCDPFVLPQLPVVICGMKIDQADEEGKRRAVSEEEVHAFARSNGVRQALVTSARTGEMVEEAFQALALAILEAEEEAEAERIVAARAPPPAESWGLDHTQGGPGALTSPRGARPREPGRGPAAAAFGGPDERLVEVIDAEGVPFSARPLAVCLEHGLRHRAVHVWICDPRTGGLLLRRHSASSSKMGQRWGPTCCDEVLCYGSTANPDAGPHVPELASGAAARALCALAPGRGADGLEHWFSCSSRNGSCNELLDVFAATLRGGSLPKLQLWQDEAVEWVHYLDVFGDGAKESGGLFHIEPTYRASMVRIMCARIVHADMESAAPPLGLAQSRPRCQLPVG